MYTAQHSNVVGCPADDDRMALESLYSLGHWLFGEKRYADAATVFRVMMKAFPTDERGWLALGHCHEGLGQREIALEIYGGGAVAAEPSALCHLARFRALWEMDRSMEADEALEAARGIAQEKEDQDLRNQIEEERRARP